MKKLIKLSSGLLVCTVVLAGAVAPVAVPFAQTNVVHAEEAAQPAEEPKFVSYTAVAETDVTLELPADVFELLPWDHDYTTGDETKLPNPITKEVEDVKNNGKWVFVKWYPRIVLLSQGGGEVLVFVSVWNFVPNKSDAKINSVYYTAFPKDESRPSVADAVFELMKEEHPYTAGDEDKLPEALKQVVPDATNNGKWVFEEWQAIVHEDTKKLEYRSIWSFVYDIPKFIYFDARAKAGVKFALPEAVKKHLPKEREYVVGEKIVAPDAIKEEVVDEANGGKWVFEKWEVDMADLAEEDSTAATFIAIWDFVPVVKEVPKEDIPKVNKPAIKVTKAYRLRNPKTGAYLFTRNANEVNKLVGYGWVNEGTAWNSAVDKGAAVYRLRNPKTGVYFFTRNTNEVKKFVGYGWVNEGTAFRSNGTVAVYRLRSKKGAYFFTRNQSEIAKLVSYGWKNEGVAWLTEK